jgi:transcriptional regulator with XRE-family HTH domain
MLQEVLARKTGISPSALSNFEQGRRRVSLARLHRISRALGVTAADLIPESRGHKPLAQTPEEETLLAAFRKLVRHPELQDQLLTLIELVASGTSRSRRRRKSEPAPNY